VRKSPQEFFNLCSELRLQGALAMEFPPEIPQEEAETNRLLAALFDQNCLELASKRLLEKKDLSLVDQHLLPSGEIQTLPTRPLWLMLEVPQPVYGVEPEDSGDPWANERLAALFFRAPYSNEAFRHAVTPPVFGLPWKDEDQSPLWYEWRVDMIDSNGVPFRDLAYYYDQRTARWRKMEVATCPWDACGQTMDEELGYPTIVPCPLCQETLDYYTRWLATIIQGNIGKPLFLKWPELEIRKRDLLTQKRQSSARRGKRVLKAKIRLRKHDFHK
jgi:hypothetical protein